MASTSTPRRQLEIESAYAFDEIAPPSTCASATSSSTLKRLPCSVFINHRGPDVKHTLATAISHPLHSTGLMVFLDSEELEFGDFLPAALQKAMSSASLHVAIFSPGYAQSPWCLAELSFMLETGTPIIPVFYGVQPDDLRWMAQGKGVYARAFSEHQEKGRYSPEKIKEWKMALHVVSYYMGEIISSNDEEGHKLKNIMNRVSKEMNLGVPLSVAKHPVGLDDAVANFEKIAQESANLGHPKVQIVGIWGMGGAGKTTLAKELFNRKKLNVEHFSFVSDIRDAEAKKELHKKQKKLLEDVGVAKIPNIEDKEKGKEILSNCLRSVRVLVVLDDVDRSDQLDALLPMKDSLALGSLIIVTTREKEVLKCWSISSIYEMKTMNSFYAEQLLCWHAFLQPYPRLGFEKLVKKFTSACNRLPLSLEVFGSLLYCYSTKDLWEDLLHKISNILPDDIKSRLRVSYDTLNEEEKQIFLDVACFFIGEDHMKAIAVWKGSSRSGLYSWERLVNKCLVYLDNNNHIKMHDHLKDIGREIANTQSPYHLWSLDQFEGIQKQEQIRGMIVNAANKGVHKFLGSLLNTRRPFPLELKFFVVEGNHEDKLPIAEFSRKLAWLICSGIVDRNLPLTMKNLRVLELYHSRKLKGLWTDETEAPEQLRVLIISKCRKLQRIPKSIELLKNLKQMSLDSCDNVKDLPEEFCRLQSLEHLQLKRCDKLLSLPSCFGELGNLRHLDLSYSYELRMLPDSFKQLKLLQHLDLRWCFRLALGTDILENMTKLKYLDFTWCIQLEELPSHITNQAALRELYSTSTFLRKLPKDIDQLSKLRVMKIGSSLLHFKMQALPESVGSLKQLEHLVLQCLEVESLPASFKQLINLQTLEISSCPISELDFGRGPCTSSLCNLERIDLRHTKVNKISISEECCPRLITLKVWYNEHLREVETLPTTVENIELLECSELVALPSFAKLTSLKVFELRKCNKVEKIQGLQHCSALEQLVVENSCWEVPGIESLEQMQGLRTLQLVTKKRAAVEPCIQTIQKQKWPEEIIICTKAVPGAGSLLKSSDFPNLSVLHSFENKKIPLHNSWRTALFNSFLELKVQGKCSFNANANVTMVCLVINCLSPCMELVIKDDLLSPVYKRKYDPSSPFHGWEDDPFPKSEDNPIYKSKDDPIYKREMVEGEERSPYMVWSRGMEEGRWIWIGVFRQHTEFFTAQELFIRDRRDFSMFEKRNKVEKGLVLRGEENNVAEAFYRTLAHLGN